MNNIELNALKNDLKKYLGYTDHQIENLGKISDMQLNSMKRDIDRIKSKYVDGKSNTEIYQRNLFRKKIEEILKVKVELKDSPEIDNRFHTLQLEQETVKTTGKPKILFICDVKGWAWWIKSEYIKRYISDEFDVDIVHVIGDGSTPMNIIDQNKYDFYFTYGFSYIDFLYRVPMNKKATGVTAHRNKNVIFPKMKLAGHVHANSILLLKELMSMGFKDTFYLPNGVDEELFKITNPIKEDGELMVGHVGKESPHKGQREFIIPAINAAGVRSVTNLRTYKDKLPHHEMPQIYNQMDVFVVASDEDGTPNPALEAAACGRPIISNNIGNMPEFIEDGYNGFIVPKSIDAYVEKIDYFKKNRKELIRMGENARKTVLENWTWKKQSENYREMFRKIFGKTN